MKRISLLVLVFVMCAQMSWAAREKVDTIAEDPYKSALVVDANTGQVLFEDHAETTVYPASVLKLMDLLIIIEQVEQGKVKLNDMVQVTKEAAHMGGSQVYLDPKEQFSVQDLLFALAVQSANDAAVALAIHVAGSTEGFVALMNKKAQDLGMKNSHFYSVHGLPPSKGQKTDETTAHDLSLLSLELVKHPEIFEYTGAKERSIRDGSFVMRNHNHLLGRVNGCDGFKTGYFQAAGFSIVATAKRGGVRIIAVVLGSKDRKVRDAKAEELLAKGFALVPPKPEAVTAVMKSEIAPAKTETAVVAAPEKALSQEEQKEVAVSAGSDKGSDKGNGSSWKFFFLGLVVGLVIAGVAAFFMSQRRPPRNSNKLSYR